MRTLVVVALCLGRRASGLAGRRFAVVPRALRRPAPLRAAPLATEDEISTLLAGDAYAMDISSITPDSERETYIGQGSGVNEGTGLGALGGYVQKLVGRYLCWRNAPVYDDLWEIIEDDLLGLCRERVPELAPGKTWFDDAAGPHAFATADGACSGEVAGYAGGPIDWVTTCKFFSRTLGFGNMRIDGWLNRDSRAPHLAVHLCIVFNVLFIYARNPSVFRERRGGAGRRRA